MGDPSSHRFSGQSLFRSPSGSSMSPANSAFRRDSNPVLSLGGNTGGGRRSSGTGGVEGNGGPSSGIAHMGGTGRGLLPTFHGHPAPNAANIGFGSQTSSRRMSRARTPSNVASRMLSTRPSLNSRDSTATAYYYAPSSRGMPLDGTGVGGGGGGDSLNGTTTGNGLYPGGGLMGAIGTMIAPAPLQYNSIRIEGEVSDEDFAKSADVLAQIITARQSYKALDKGELEEPFSDEMLARIQQAEPTVNMDLELLGIGSLSGNLLPSWNTLHPRGTLETGGEGSPLASSGGVGVGMRGMGSLTSSSYASGALSGPFAESQVNFLSKGEGDGAVPKADGGGRVSLTSGAEEDLLGTSSEKHALLFSSPGHGPAPTTATPTTAEDTVSSLIHNSNAGVVTGEEVSLNTAKGRVVHTSKSKKSIASGEEVGGVGVGPGLLGEMSTPAGPTTMEPAASASLVPASSFLTYQDGFFSFTEQRTQPIAWEKYVEDMRAVYSAIENGPCLSVARMRLTTVAEKFQLYSLLNYEHENNYDEYIKGGVYGSGPKVDNAVRIESSVPAPTFLEYIVMTAKQYPRVPLFTDPNTGRVVTLREWLEENEVPHPEEMTIGGLGLQPSAFSKKNVSARKMMLDEKSNPSGKFGATLVRCFLSMRGPSNGDLFGGLIRSELEQMEYKKQQIWCTERQIPLHGHHRNEVYEVASWIRHQGFHKYHRNRWVLSLGTHLPKLHVNSLSIQAKTVEDLLYNLFHPLFMATLYPNHPEWRDVALMLQHTSAISVSTSQRSRTKNLSSRAIPPNTVKLANNPNEYYLFYYYWCNYRTLNALRKALDLNTFYFTSAVYERPPAFDQLVCGFLLSDVVYHHGLSLQKSWVMQYVYMMCRVGIVLSPLCDNLMGVPYFDHPVVQFFRQGMQVSLCTSSPLHCHHRVDQPLVEEYATLMKLWSLTPQDMAEIARNSILNSNFPKEWKQQWLEDPYYSTATTAAAAAAAAASGTGDTRSSISSQLLSSLSGPPPPPAPSRPTVCPYRLQFRQETIIHEVTLLHLVCSENATRKGRRSTLPLLYPLGNMGVDGDIRLPDVTQQFRSSKRLHYIDKRVIFPRITINLTSISSQAALTEASELIRQVVLLRRKYIHSYTTDVKVEDVFSRAHSFNEDDHEYNNYYGVFVLSKVGHIPMWASFIPTIAEYIKDVNTVRRAVTSRLLQRLCSHRLKLLERKFLLHLSMNITNEAGKREEKEWNNRDFFTAHKVDNNIFNDAGLNARTLLEYFLEKVTHHGEDVVREENSIPITLGQLITRYKINMSCITVDELNYQMTTHPDLWSLFLSPDNYMQGRYFAELTKRKLESDKEDAYCYAENCLRIYGSSPNEWYMLAHWFDRYGMASSHNRWMIALPRNYPSLFKKGVVKNFGEFLDHLFSPLWDISLHPAKDTKFHYFLTHVSGFDCVDEESNIDAPMDVTYPHDWNTGSKPSYATYLYYFWANIASLNKFRASRGLGTFSFRPQCGEFGHSDHLIAGFLLANSINHGVTLAKHPVLEYLYYITQIGVAMSPLSNTAGASPYLSNPFPEFFHRGLNVSLATNQPLYFHFTREPLIEEYSIAAKLWKFEFNDLSEIARNSVRQSGFPPSWKEKALGKRYFLHSTLGNEVRHSRVSNIRVAFRFETYHSELDFLDAQLQPSVVQRVPRAMLTLAEERRVVAEAPDNPLGQETKMALEKYLSGLRQHLRRKSAQSRIMAATTAAAAAAAAASSAAVAGGGGGGAGISSSTGASSSSSSSSYVKGKKSGFVSSLSSRSTTPFRHSSTVSRENRPSSVSLEVSGEVGGVAEKEGSGGHFRRHRSPHRTLLSAVLTSSSQLAASHLCQEGEDEEDEEDEGYEEGEEQKGVEGEVAKKNQKKKRRNSRRRRRQKKQNATSTDEAKADIVPKTDEDPHEKQTSESTTAGGLTTAPTANEPLPSLPPSSLFPSFPTSSSSAGLNTGFGSETFHPTDGRGPPLRQCHSEDGSSCSTSASREDTKGYSENSQTEQRGSSICLTSASVSVGSYSFFDESHTTRRGDSLTSDRGDIHAGEGGGEKNEKSHGREHKQKGRRRVKKHTLKGGEDCGEGEGGPNRGVTDPALLAAVKASVAAAAAAIRTQRDSITETSLLGGSIGAGSTTSAAAVASAIAAAEDTGEDPTEDNRVLLEGALSRADLLTTKKFLQHDIRTLQYRIEELQTCMRLLADSNNRMAEEILHIMNRRLAMEKGMGMRIEGQLEHKEEEDEEEEGEEDEEEAEKKERPEDTGEEAACGDAEEKKNI